jgi:hypothetical protein
MLVPHQELPAADGPQPMEGEGLAIRSAVCTRPFPSGGGWWLYVFPFGFPTHTPVHGFAVVAAAASGGADGAREQHCREPACGRPADITVHLDYRELHPDQHQEALL